MADNPNRVRRWTRHSIVLTGAGVIYICIGVAFFTAPPEVTKAPSLKIALTWFSIEAWGIIFCAAGVFAMAAAWSVLGHKTWGYMVLTALSSAWSAAYALAVIIDGAPLLTLVSAATWGLLAFIWWAVSGLISPEHLKSLVGKHHGYS